MEQRPLVLIPFLLSAALYCFVLEKRNRKHPATMYITDKGGPFPFMLSLDLSAVVFLVSREGFSKQVTSTVERNHGPVFFTKGSQLGSERGSKSYGSLAVLELVFIVTFQS